MFYSLKRTAVACVKLEELGDLWKEYDVLGIDEAQFYDDIVEFSVMAAGQGKIVIMSSLNGQCIQVPFDTISRLIPLCEKVKKLSAICKLCSHNANYTFRTAAMVSAEGDQNDFIGGAEAYIPLCRECLDYKNE